MNYLDAKRLTGTSAEVIETLSVSDNFSSDNFTHNTPSQTSVTGGVLEIKHRLTTTPDFAWKSLGMTLGTKWVMRLKLNTSVRSSSGANPNTVGLFTLSAGNTNDMTVNGIGFRVQLGAPTEIFGIALAGGSSNQTGAESYVWSSDSTTSVINTGITKWIEITRNESNLTLKIFSDSFITLQETLTATFTGTVAGLQYFTYKNRANNTASHTATINIDDLKIYNGVSSLTSKPQKPIPLNGCKAYYKFEETSGNLINQATTANTFPDGLNSSADGTPSGGVTQTATGKIGNAWSFDGSNDRVDITSFTIPTNVSVSVWVNPTAIAIAPSHNPRLFHWYDGTNQLQIVFNVGSSVTVFDNANNTGVQTALADLPPLSSWTHYVGTRESGTYKLYKNGVLLSTTTTAEGNPSPTTSSIRLGADITGASADGHLNGRLDELSFWNRALTSAEISALYNSGAGRLLTGQPDPQINSLYTETDTGRIYWYNGNSWSASSLYYLNNAIIAGGFDTGSNTLFTVESYNGTSWSIISPLSTARKITAGGGNNTNAIAFGGRTAADAYLTSTEEWNGASWSAGGNLVTPKANGAGGGNSSDAIQIRGYTTSHVKSDTVQEYNGTSWASGGSCPPAAGFIGGDGNSVDAIVAGGYSDAPATNYNSTFEYNGTSWSSGGNLAAINQSPSLGGSTTNAINIDGWTGSYTNNTQEYDGTTWSAGGAITINRYFGGARGNRDKALTTGTAAVSSNTSEEYNGTTWSAGGNISVAKSRFAMGGNA